MRTYSELITIPSFEDRFKYVSTNSLIGEATFGYERYLNQYLYNTYEWKHEVRRKIILRDKGCDLAFPDYEIQGPIYVHHLNPITIEDILNRADCLFDPENLVCCSFKTHNALHFNSELPKYTITERAPNDTCPWRITK